MANGTLEPVLEDGDCILEPRRGHSAMYSGIKSLEKDMEMIQIGWVGELADQDGYVVPYKHMSEKHKQSLKDKLWEKEKVVPIFLEDSRAAGHYEGYCKSGKVNAANRRCMQDQCWNHHPCRDFVIVCSFHSFLQMP